MIAAYGIESYSVKGQDSVETQLRKAKSKDAVEIRVLGMKPDQRSASVLPAVIEVMDFSIALKSLTIDATALRVLSIKRESSASVVRDFCRALRCATSLKRFVMSSTLGVNKILSIAMVLESLVGHPGLQELCLCQIDLLGFPIETLSLDCLALEYCVTSPLCFSTMKLVTLKLKGTSPEGVGKYLDGNTVLTTLGLDHCKLEQTEEKAIAEALLVNTTLTSLDMGYTCAHEQTAYAFANVLRTNSTLTALDLHWGNSANELSTEAKLEIARAVTCNTTIRELMFDFRKVKGVEEILSKNVSLQRSYYDDVACTRTTRRNEIVSRLKTAGFTPRMPDNFWINTPDLRMVQLAKATKQGVCFEMGPPEIWHNVLRMLVDARGDAADSSPSFLLDAIRREFLESTIPSCNLRMAYALEKVCLTSAAIVVCNRIYNRCPFECEIRHFISQLTTGKRCQCKYNSLLCAKKACDVSLALECMDMRNPRKHE